MANNMFKQLAEKYPFIKSFKKKDNNLYEALNYGISKASGEYLHLLHSGDFYYFIMIIYCVNNAIITDTNPI